MSDEVLRALERLALEGDEGARLALERARERMRARMPAPPWWEGLSGKLSEHWRLLFEQLLTEGSVFQEFRREDGRGLAPYYGLFPILEAMDAADGTATMRLGAWERTRTVRRGLWDENWTSRNVGHGTIQQLGPCPAPPSRPAALPRSPGGERLALALLELGATNGR